MTTLDGFQDLLTGCTGGRAEVTLRADHRLDVRIVPGDLIEAALALRERAYLSAITGLDLGDIAVLYHFCAGADIITLRVLLPRTDAIISTIAHVTPAAALYERELREMFGVTVSGLRDTGYLFLPDDWPPGVYPLRKDAPLAELESGDTDHANR